MKKSFLDLCVKDLKKEVFNAKLLK
jgi:hypothetical protein